MDIVYFIFQQTMFFSIPLLIVSLGGMFSERSGVVNIALEGIMIIGAFLGVLFINIFQEIISNPQILILLALLVAGLGGAVFSLLHSVASVSLKSNQIISGTALNMFAPAFVIFFARTKLGSEQIKFLDRFFIKEVPVLSNIPIIGKLFFTNAYITTYVCIIIFIALNIMLNKTSFGLHLKACGEHPQAADTVGVNVYKIRYLGVIISGILAGIGGLTFVIPTSTNFAANVAGYGFLAIAVLIFGQWRPIKIIGASFFFGIMKAFSSTYSGISFLKELSIPNEVYKIIPYLVTLIVLAFLSKNSHSPKALGVPYDKGER